jgi:hypothetical protein
MIPWTAIGSLIAYYTEKYGKSYFVLLNLAFYGVGYPVSVLQQWLDLYYDTIYGSTFTFQYRLTLALFTSLIAMTALPFVDQNIFLLLTALIGVCTWASHGSASTLAGLIKMNSPILQQIGFVLPGIYSVIMVFALHLKSAEVSVSERVIFFYIAGAIMIPGLIAWVRHLPAFFSSEMSFFPSLVHPLPISNC